MPVRSVASYEHLPACRVQRGLTQEELAEALATLAFRERGQRVGVTAAMVSKWERGMKRPSRLYRELLCGVLTCTPAELGFVSEHVPALDPVEATPIHVAQSGEEVLDILERIQWAGGTNVSDGTLAQFDTLITDAIDTYEETGPKELAPRVLRQRRWVDALLRGQQHPRQREQLFAAAARLSGLLAYMSVNLGHFAAGRAYCAEAFQLAELLADSHLQAWVRATESFGAYYTGQYQVAVDLARDGLRYAGNGPQAVRLAVNGEARALAKLGDERGTLEAVDRAYAMLDRHEATPGVSPCISFGIYSPARTASNAATAFVSLRRPDKVREHLDQTAPIFDNSSSVWSRSLMRLDLATALVLADDPEPEQASALVREAVALSARRPITSVVQRSQEYLVAARPWRRLPAVTEAAEAVRAVAR